VRQPLSPYQLEWPAPVVFQQGSFMATGLSSAGFKIGTLYMQYQVLGYVSQFRSGAS
jgi:hypothetical protein